MFQYEGDKYSRITACFCLFKWKMRNLTLSQSGGEALKHNAQFSQLNEMKGTNHQQNVRCAEKEENCGIMVAENYMSRDASARFCLTLRWAALCCIRHRIWFIHRNDTDTRTRRTLGLGAEDVFSFHRTHNFVGDALHSCMTTYHLYENIVSHKTQKNEHNIVKNLRHPSYFIHIQHRIDRIH